MYSLELLKQLMGGEEAFISRFLQAFRSDVPAQMTLLREHLAAREWESASIVAHGIKSQLKYLMAEDAVKTAYTIEKQAATGENLPGLMAHIEKLDALIRRICSALDASHGTVIHQRSI